MLHAEVPALRQPCPACECERDTLLEAAGADIRVLQLTQMQEKNLIARIDSIRTYEELQRVIARMQDNLGVTLRIIPSPNGVSTLKGFDIKFDAWPGLCKKTQSTIPAAIRRCLGRHQEIAFAILDKDSLFG